MPISRECQVVGNIDINLSFPIVVQCVFDYLFCAKILIIVFS